MRLTIAVCGTDHPHAGGHLQALESLHEVGQLLIWDANPQRAREVAGRSAKAQAVDDLEGVVADHSADALVCLLPNRAAGPATLRAIQAGMYVYGDKPGALSAAQMQAIVAAADQSGAHFCPCYPWRVDPVTHEIKRLIEAGVLGQIWAAQATWITSQVALRDPTSWLFSNAEAGGGILAWLACHWIDLLAFLLGPATDVTAMVATQCSEPIDVEDTATVVLRLASGALATVRAGYAHKPFFSYDDQDLHVILEGSLGSIYWPTHSRQGYRLRTAHPDYAGISRRWVHLEYDPAPEAGYSPDFLRAFLKSVVNRSLPPATERDALYVLQVLQAAYASSVQRRHVSLPPPQ